MVLAQGLSGPQLVLLGLAILTIGIVLRRGIRRRQQLQSRDPLREVRNDFRTREQSPASQLRQMEVRLYEFSREVEGRMQTRLALLDELIHEADREIARLNSLLSNEKADPSTEKIERRADIVISADPLETYGEEAASRQTSGTIPLPPSAHDSRRRAYEEQMAHHLAAAGFRASEIAHCLDCPLEWVEQLLATRADQDEDRGNPRTRAA